jgi:hypothetical protein
MYASYLCAPYSENMVCCQVYMLIDFFYALKIDLVVLVMSLCFFTCSLTISSANRNICTSSMIHYGADLE